MDWPAFQDFPPDDAYGRVTNPERFLPIQAAARDLINRLTAEYDVRRIDGVDLDPRTAESWPGSKAVRLEPTSDSAPITFTFTPFPGLCVRYGFIANDGFPSRGCDACLDDDPVSEAARMVDVVEGVVAGRYTEVRKSRLGRPDIMTTSLVLRNGSVGRGPGSIEPLDESLPLGTTEWGPWRERD